MLQHLMGAFRHGDANKSSVAAFYIEKAFMRDDIQDVVERINALFATIPYEIFQAKSEAYYHSLIHLIFSLVGVKIDSQVITSKGRADAVVETQDFIYILEFKLDKTVEEALTQIQQRGYANRYKTGAKRIKAIGVNFSSVTKEIEGWRVVEVE